MARRTGNTPTEVRDPDPDGNTTPAGAPGDRPPASLDVASGNAPEHPEGATTPSTEGPGYSSRHIYDTPWGRRVLHPDQVDQLRRDYTGSGFEFDPVESVDDPSEVVNPEREARTSAELATGERIADTPAVRAAEVGDRLYAGEQPGTDTTRPSDRQEG